MVKIFTDSSADFEPKELEAMGVECLPLTISFGDKSYKENQELSKDDFYRLLSEHDQLPQTSQVTPYEFEEAWRPYQEQGESIVAIMLSSNLSGTYHSAEIAKQNLGYDNCYVFDSLVAAASLRVLVEFAVKLRDKGKTAPQIIEKLN